MIQPRGLAPKRRYRPTSKGFAHAGTSGCIRCRTRLLGFRRCHLHRQSRNRSQYEKPPLPSLVLAAFLSETSSDGLAISRVLLLAVAHNHCWRHKKRGTTQANGFPRQVLGERTANFAEIGGFGVKRPGLLWMSPSLAGYSQGISMKLTGPRPWQIQFWLLFRRVNRKTPVKPPTQS